MKRILIAATTLILVAGCAPMGWVKPDASAAELQQDMQQCQQAAWDEANYQSFQYFGSYGPFMYRDAFGRRYAAWPRSPFYDPFGDRFFEESRLARFCMRAKGYELAPLEK
jgi:hypothetical protein